MSLAVLPSGCDDFTDTLPVKVPVLSIRSLNGQVTAVLTLNGEAVVVQT